ncbi:hypothetical protein HYV83_02515 [Candidatus Woesearchaeota archaeon]|nr:hypothetical protein [Candidatus Woesearchaeota archaeon]
MRRVLLDTNVYGEIAIDPAVARIRERFVGSQKFVFYGNEIIRKELRDTPKAKRFGDSNLRIILLSLYDDVTKDHILEVNSEVMELAENFYEAYKEVGGLKPKSEIISDFLIVSAAAVHNLDVVVSSDEKTMLTENALKAYRLITAVKKKKMPDMILYDKFRRWFV